MRSGELDGVFTDAERVRRKLEIAEPAAARLPAFIDVADDVRVRQARVLENELAVLIEAPAALVVRHAHAQARRVRRNEEFGSSLLNGNVRIGSRAHEKKLGDAAVRDETLLAVQE